MIIIILFICIYINFEIIYFGLFFNSPFVNGNDLKKSFKAASYVRSPSRIELTLSSFIQNVFKRISIVLHYKLYKRVKIN